MNFNVIAFSTFVPLLLLYLAKIYHTRLIIFIFSKRFDSRTFENRPSKQVYCGASDKQSLDKGKYPRLYSTVHQYFKAVLTIPQQYKVYCEVSLCPRPENTSAFVGTIYSRV